MKRVSDYLKRILCHLNLHQWGGWSTHPLRGNWITRQCLRCFKLEDRRLF